MAAKNKFLAKNNKSGAGNKATKTRKKQRAAALKLRLISGDKQ
jgi:hypothetical protein